MESVAWKTMLFPYLPESIRNMLSPVDERLPLEELRIRAGQPLQLVYTGGERMLRRESGAAAVGTVECAEILQRICQQSLYAWEEELKSGFMTLPGGCRVGLCGVMRAAGGGYLSGDVSCFNFRIARMLPEAADALIPLLIDRDGALCPTLILSPPGGGKTTMLRAIARRASCGMPGLRPLRVGVVDTRYELAGSVLGVPAIDLGPRTDVLSGVRREKGMRMLVSSMAPELLITDELSTEEEAAAACDARNCGVTLIASAHADGAEALLARPSMRLLLRERVFKRFAILSARRGEIAAVLDAGLNPVRTETRVCIA